jgi:glycosyltransferase involved in cell wall biosynthesis
VRSTERAPSTFYRVVRDSPNVVHACGPDSWRAASLAARLTGAAVVLDVPLAGGAGGRRHRRLAHGGPLGRHGGAVLVEEEPQATEVRSALGLPYLPPVVPTPLRGDGDSQLLSAVYQRLPWLSPHLGSQERGGVVRRGMRLLPTSGELLRPRNLGRPFAVAAYLRARLLRAAGRNRKAIAVLSSARRRDPENSKYALEAGMELARQGRRVEARQAADELRAIGERGGRAAAEALARAAIVHLALGDLAAGRELASAAVDMAPPGSGALPTAALALERAGEPSRALELADQLGADAQADRLRGLLRQLGEGWTPPVRPIRRWDRPDDRAALCLLEASMPQVPSGYAYRSRDVLAALAASGIEPVAATRLGFPVSRGILDYSPVESVYGVVHHRFNFGGLRHYSGIPLDRLATANAESLRGLVEGLRPKVVLAATPSLNGSVGRALSSAADIPFVYDVRGFPEMTWATRPGGDESELYRLRREAETGCCAAADAVITTSETMKAELVGRGIDAGKVTVVPHVVDTQRYSPQPRDEGLARSYGLDNGFVVGSITSLTEYEGLDELLRAVARARGEQDVRGLIVGDGPARPALEAQARELGIDDAVVFTGRVPEGQVTQHYALLDAVALPRRDLEVCRAVTPLKPFEAMAMGLPVIASDLPALAEPVVQSGGGLLVPPGSEEALATAILQLAGDVKMRERLGSNARAHLVAHHDPAVAADSIRSALTPLLG